MNAPVWTVVQAVVILSTIKSTGWIIAIVITKRKMQPPIFRRPFNLDVSHLCKIVRREQSFVLDRLRQNGWLLKRTRTGKPRVQPHRALAFVSSLYWSPRRSPILYLRLHHSTMLLIKASATASGLSENEIIRQSLNQAFKYAANTNLLVYSRPPRKLPARRYRKRILGAKPGTREKLNILAFCSNTTIS